MSRCRVGVGATAGAKLWRDALDASAESETAGAVDNGIEEKEGMMKMTGD